MFYNYFCATHPPLCHPPSGLLRLPQITPPPLGSADLQLGKPRSYPSLCGSICLRTTWEQCCVGPEKKHLFSPLFCGRFPALPGSAAAPNRERRGLPASSSPRRSQGGSSTYCLFVSPYPAPGGLLRRTPKDRPEVRAATKPKRPGLSRSLGKPTRPQPAGEN